VIECGIGGRLDATNIIDDPICSVITSIGLDHMELIGDTLDLIANEKSGIIK
jgi:dihydrofolate synthase/folylpolyglutamate synthase